MMTVKQVAELTGVSVRTLQFYDEIGLLKPPQTTTAGYRLYDENALETLQQILFFKELDFSLKEIQAIMENPHFDRMTAYEKQRDLIQMKRDRLDGLLNLLNKLIKGESCMEFKEFDMSEYFRILSQFKETHSDDIIKRMGSLKQFDAMVSDLKDREEEIARMAVKQYGNLENYTKAMEKNLQNYLSDSPAIDPSKTGGLIEKTEALTRSLTADLSRDPASPQVQKAAEALISFTNDCSKALDMGEGYWETMAKTYMENPVYIEVNDRKYGEGASKFIGRAIKAYLDKQA